MSIVLNSVYLFLFEKSLDKPFTFGNKSDARFSLMTTVGNKTNSSSLLRAEDRKKPLFNGVYCPRNHRKDTCRNFLDGKRGLFNATR